MVVDVVVILVMCGVVVLVVTDDTLAPTPKHPPILTRTLNSSPG